MKQKLSIGIPTYNQGPYLEKAILSVLNQTVQPYEFIICNNHSTDGITDEVLSKYQDKVRIISPPKHIGLMANFDYLARQMSGDWITFTCSDDYFEPNFVQIFYENINEDAVLHRFGIN
jgi:glycosyltransferase involved in cell wall biosynthesis